MVYTVSKRLESHNKQGIMSFLGKCMLVFMIVYKNTPIVNYTFITSERVAIIILMIVIFFENSFVLKFNKSYKANITWRKMLIFQSILLIYSLVLLALFGAGDGLTISEDIINFIIFATMAYYALTQIITSTDELMKILLVISLFQSVIIILGLISSSFANIIDSSIFNQNGVYWSYSYYRIKGYPGGIACIAAKGVFQLSLGCIASYYFVQKKRKTFLYICCFAVISLAMIAIARTGLLVTLIILVFILGDWNNINHKFTSIYVLIIFLIVGLFVATMIVDKATLHDSLSKNFSRLIDLKERGIYDSFLKYYFHGSDTVIPSISVNTIIGTGITSGITGSGIIVNADGAFIRMYVAIGLPLAIIFYIILIKYMNRIRNSLINKSMRNVALIFIILMLVGEFKEFYFYSRYMIVLYFVFAYLTEREQRMVSSE